MINKTPENNNDNLGELEIPSAQSKLGDLADRSENLFRSQLNLSNNTLVNLYERISRINIDNLKEELASASLGNKEDSELIAKLEQADYIQLLSEIEKVRNSPGYKIGEKLYGKTLLPKELLNSCQNPTNPLEHLAGACAGIFESGITVGITVAEIFRDFVKSFYHIPMALAGKVEISSFKNV